MVTRRESEPSSAEVTLTRIWCDVLRISELDVTADFFDVGGHSLLIPQILSRINQEFGTVLSIRDFLRAPTVRLLAEATTARAEQR